MRHTRLARQSVIAVLAVICLLGFGSSVALAAPTPDYLSQVATALRSEPVFVDAHASPTITAAQAAQLDSQIRSTGKPIYLVLMDNGQAAGTSEGALLASIHNALGPNTSEVIGVSTSQGFWANGYDLPSAVANGAGEQASRVLQQAKASGHVDPFTVYQNWIAGVASIGSNASGNSSAATASAPQGVPGWVIFLIILGVLVVMVIIIVAIVRTVSNHRQHRRERDRLQRRADVLNDSLLAMSTDAELKPAANKEYTLALEELQTARQALSANDYQDAASHLDEAKYHYQRAQAILDGRDPNDTPQPQTSNGARFQRPDGTTVIVNNTPMAHESSDYPYYYGGGWYGGMYYGPGYYPYSFWDWMVLDSIFNGDRDDYHHGGDNSNGGNWGDPGGWGNGNVPSGSTDGGDWGSSGGSGTDWGGVVGGILGGIIDAGNPGGGSW